MRQLKIGLCLLLFALVLAPAVRAQLMERAEPGDVRVFQVKLRSKGAAPGFNPFLVIVRPHDKVRLVITSVDKDCDFAIRGLNIHQKVKKGVPATIEFTVHDEGKFDFSCGGMLSHEIHHEAKGTLVVKKSAEAPTPASGGA
jgi:plastocyanin